MPVADPNTTPAATKASHDAEELAYYKAQYEQLEVELAEFQASSRELEAELEKDIEASEKRERHLKGKVETLSYEVEEWKTKYKQAKAEASSVQNTLQKEITSLREGNRALQLKLRDIEVANDDYERQARNTTSSLEDLESKYNMAIERAVLLDDEVKAGEQEREALRIESQRLRDELSDLKIEADIITDKLRKAENELNRRRKQPALLDPSVAHGSQNAEAGQHSPVTTSSSPTMNTPPAKSVSSATSDAITPPSPSASESSVSVRKQGAEGGFSGTRVSLGKTAPHSAYARHTRTPSIPQANGYSTPSMFRQSTSRMSSSGIPRSGSLYQIRGLIGKMQKLEERVHSARSRLPAPVETPTGMSPRTPSAAGQSSIPSSVTLRKSSRKRTSTGSANSSVRDGDTSSYPSSFLPQSRQSFGRSNDSRPSSRTSFSSRSSIGPGNYASSIAPSRPDSRQSRARTPLGHYSTNPTTESRRPRSSMSSYSQNHAPAKSMTFIEEDVDIPTPTPRRGTLDQGQFRSSIPAPGSLKKRPSSIGQRTTTIPTPRRVTSKIDVQKREPKASGEEPLKLEDLGETY
ncbi:nuclear distribution protein NudE [Talaromyces stipitatus ATCC 10500]|uniref:Nuclear distribution protein NudE n=1 Tax=Talaromyces stipitatus (strain ATCC 10500 / CBS 375.48 / QM 6759 / NRRL 1006) TaxID=441959 RepID=B8M2J2_TALSN|nr:nuclear distribution protein NudE [Talaromyces stipitatus ATCC 10500]EED21903.1 nuclear distribution protein NudE [Talaromyces stipitatus ATCC 10500]